MSDLHTLSLKQRVERLEAEVDSLKERLEVELLKKKPRFGVFVLETGELTKWQFDSFEEAQEEALGLDRFSTSLVDGKFAMGLVKKYIVKPI